ncbi:MAG: hypothetical protein R2939_15280 [Kofleriaceae bacterium]
MASIISRAVLRVRRDRGLDGLLSWLFPPLALLVPYIPAAINLGRVASGVSNVCCGVSTLLSPIPPLLRAMHVIFSSQDPIKLVAQETAYHDEMQDAIQTWSAAGLAAGIERMQAPAPAAGRSTEVAPKASAVDRVSEFVGIKGGMEEIAIGGQGLASFQPVAMPDPKTADAMSADYFDTGRKPADATDVQRADDRVRRGDRDARDADRQLAFRERVNAANPSAKNGARLEQAQGAVASAAAKQDKLRIERAVVGQRAAIGDTTLDLAEVSDMVAETGTELITEEPEAKREFVATDADRAAFAAAPRSAAGHVVLPPPPGGLADIDQLDRQIAALRAALPQQHAITAGAKATHADATARGKGIAATKRGLDQHVARQGARTAAEQQRIAAQDQQLHAAQAEGTQTAASGTQRVAGPLAGIATVAHTIDAVLQRVPSNKFFDISSAKRGVHQFATGIDQITAAPGSQQESAAKSEALIAGRGQQASAAAAKHGAAQGAGQKLGARLAHDQAAVADASSQAQAVVGESSQAEAALAAELATATAERQRRWEELTAWAQAHHALRRQADPTATA